ncbi:MAG: DUF5012 domain-containing protein [Bacteroidales bacterium]|nr:DUF5012 domain-containing protein [Bacteroidales bacterium]MBN2748544.1 DUF5012 domain-containing protein [Bacteroidales bacterium]
MKKIFFLSLLVLPFLFSCEKETEGVSRTTFFAELTLTGPGVVVMPVNSTYVEPGYVAIENEVDVSANVQVTGGLNTSEVGAYELTYTVLNADGFPKTASRLVLVVPANLSSADLTGTFTGQRTGAAAVPSACNINKLADGVFFADDLFGGYYNKVAGYGLAYRLKTYFVLNSDNTIIALWSDSPWGPWEVLNGVYNPTTNVITHTVKQGTFSFGVTLTKELE